MHIKNKTKISLEMEAPGLTPEKDNANPIDLYPFINTDDNHNNKKLHQSKLAKFQYFRQFFMS